MTGKKGLMAATAVSALAMLWTGSAMAASVICPTAAISAERDTQITLTVPDAITAFCYDYGAAGETGAQYDVTTTGAPVVFDNNVLELPTGSGTDNLGWLSGTFDNGTSGTFNVLTSAAGPMWLVLKTGGGQNDPYWFAFQLSSITAGQSISWLLSGGQNALSNTALYGGTSPPPPDEVPEPATLALLGLGLLGLGMSRRRKAA